MTSPVTVRNAVVAAAKNRVTSVKDGSGATVRTLTYLTGGDLSQDARAGGSTLDYVHDGRNRLKTVRQSGADVATYAYDAFGRRVQRTLTGPGTTTDYIYDPQGRLLAEHDHATGAVLREYVWLGDLPLAVVAGGSTYFITTGQLDEPLLMTDAAKAKVWDAAIEPFGEAKLFSPPTVALDLRLPGQQLQAEAGPLHQNWMRDYDPSLGRYIEADPLGIDAGQNVYAYVDGRVMEFVDPEGLDNTSAWGLGFEWLTGLGPRTHHFTNNDPLTNVLRRHSHIQQLVEEICLGIRDPAGRSPYSLAGVGGVSDFIEDYSAVATGGLTGNIAAAYLGSYGLTYTSSTSSVTIHVFNTSDVRSATHPPIIGYTPWWNQNVGAFLNSLFKTGPLSPTRQTFDFNEPLDCTCRVAR